tara:strand:- start:3839 stop:4183 length:345 start_codon:yes stop_codon:yes gene_type:complete
MKIFEYENIQYYIGETAKENWELLDTLLQENSDYIWFHLNSFPSSYVIMKTDLLEISEKSHNDYLIYGATLCRDNTKYRNLKNLKVCYTRLKKLKKGSKVGEVIIKGKFGIIKL